MLAVWQKLWIIVQWLIKARSISVPPVSFFTPGSPESSPMVPSAQRGGGAGAGGRRRGPWCLFTAGKEVATHICTEDKTSQALWRNIKAVFSQRVQQIQLFPFLFFCSFPKARFHLSFVPVAMVTGQRSGQRIGAAGGRDHIWDPYYSNGGVLCIIIVWGSLDSERKTMVQVEEKKRTEIFK